MLNRAARSPENHQRRHWPALSIVIASAALFIALGGTAVAAGLIHPGDIARGAVTSKAIRNGGIWPQDLTASTKASLQGAKGATGLTGGPEPTAPTA
jgi:hypothetical protein